MSDLPLLHPFRIWVKGTLTALSPLHVGTGDFDYEVLPVPKGTNAAPALATVLRDAEGNPFIPGSTLKNLLRRLHDGNGTDQLFGAIKDSPSKSGTMGAVIVYGCSATKIPNGIKEAPYRKVSPGLKAGAYVAARTAIAPTTGVADAHKLFHQEMVAPGTEFAFRLLIVGDSKEKAEHTLADLAPALDILTSAGGQIGKGQADGQGLIKALNLTYTICSIGTDGRLVEKQLQKPVPKSAGRNKAAKESWTITLSCPGPYLSTDASRQRDPRIPRDETKAEPHVYAQRFDDTTPIVSGTSIMGALRARAAWLHALDLRLQGKDDDCIAKSIRTDETNVVRTPGDIATLNPLQRLFGVTGYRGLLCLTQAHVSGGTLWRSTSVKLDRFSGAPIDHALFEVEAFYGVKLTLSLRLETRTGSDDQVASLAERLIEDIKANGLYLGHGTNRGFGWFTNA